MTTLKAVQDTETPPPVMSTGRRIWMATALILSVLFLALGVGGIIGAWVGRSLAIETMTDVMTGVDQLTTASREGIAQADTLITDVREVVGTVQTAADQASQNVADRGLMLNLLPADTSQELEALADQIRTNLESILSVLEATAGLIEAVGDLPFVDLPQPEEVGALQQEVQGIIAGINQLVADLRQFREDVVTEIATVAATAAQVDGRLETTQQNLALMDNELETLQMMANELMARFPSWATVTAILLTLFLLWVSYAMMRLIDAYWKEWRAHRSADKMPATAATIDEAG